LDIAGAPAGGASTCTGAHYAAPAALHRLHPGPRTRASV
jgi:hypothetical protein